VNRVREIQHVDEASACRTDRDNPTGASAPSIGPVDHIKIVVIFERCAAKRAAAARGSPRARARARRLLARRGMRIRFDRGTLVLEPRDGTHANASAEPAAIEGAVWDVQSRAWRVPAERHAELIARLGDVDDEVRPCRLADRWILPPLRWYQEAALAAWLAADRRGVVALPTGAGKTLVAMAAIARLGVAALILVPTRVLLDQWARALAAAWPLPIDGRDASTSRASSIGRLGDGEHQLAPITVATYASAVGWAPRIGDRFGLVIVDEAHHVGAWCPGEVLEMLVAPFRLGLTATPPDAPRELAARVGPVVYALAIDELVGDGLAAYRLETVPIALEREERERYRTLRARFAGAYAEQARRGELGWRRFVRQAARSARGRAALYAWRGYRALLAYPAGKREALRELLRRHAGQRTLVFTADNATAYAIARELLVVPITHEIRKAERAAVIERFRAGELSVLVSSQVLDEGLDVPDADVAIIVGGTSSSRRHVQRIGRVLRPRDGKRAVIYELVVLESTEADYVQRRRARLGPDAAPTSVGPVARDQTAAGGAP
jgi:superfamily II DNA or RNA helicase